MLDDVKGLESIEAWLKTLDLMELNEINDLMEQSQEDDNDFILIDDEQV